MIGHEPTGLWVFYQFGPGVRIHMPFSRPRLFMVSRPAAILGRVRTVIVDAIKRMGCGWARTHIGEEIWERIAPAFANRDSSPPIPLVAGGAWIQAALLHRKPRMVFGALRSCGVRCSMLRHSFQLEASTTTVMPRSQIAPSHVNDIAAFTAANPCRLPAEVGSLSDDSQSFELFSEQIDLSSHTTLYHVVRHRTAEYGG